MSLWIDLADETRRKVLLRLNDMHARHMGWSTDLDERQSVRELMKPGVFEHAVQSPAYKLIGLWGYPPEGLVNFLHAVLAAERPGENIISSRIPLMSDDKVDAMLEELGFHD